MENHLIVFLLIVGHYFSPLNFLRWLAVLLESVGNSVVLCVALFAVSARGQFSAGLTGLIISYALSLSQSLNFFVRMMAELESNIVCVERINEYSRIEQEVRPNMKYLE